MTKGLQRTIAGALIGLALVSGVHSARAGDAHDRAAAGVAPAHRGRLIVKYRPVMRACAHCLLAHGVPFATVTGTDSLDRLNRHLGVRGARSLFFEQHDLAGDREAAYLAALDATRQRFAARAARALPGTSAPNLANVYVLDLPRGTDVAAAAARYAADPAVEYAEPDFDVHATFIPNDPYFSSTGTWQQPYADLWGLQITQAATAWDTANGSGTVVAVIDTGVDDTLPDLAANMWSNPGEIPGNGIDDDGNGFVDDVRGWDFVQNDNTPYDLHGHGTHVAGTVAAVGNNGVGVVGMAWGARIMAVRGLDANGRGYDSELAQAIVYAAQNGADVLNNSWGGPGVSGVLSDAVSTASSLGAVVVAAAGNNGASVDFFEPASIPQVIAVGATQPPPLSEHAGFSNFGNALSVAAPGYDVLSLRASVSPVDAFGSVVAHNYLRLSGTSMASPHAAGLAALLLSALPGLTPDEVRWHLELNADQPGYPGYEGQPWNPYFGWGRINAARVFNTPPVTTRLRSSPFDFHAFAATLLPDVATADLLFTTRDPVAWSLSTPSWLPPGLASGSGPAQLPFSIDTTALGVGTYTGSVLVDAPGTVDGGGSLAANVQVHRDDRVGDVILVTSDHRDQVEPPQPPVTVGTGAGALLAWSEVTQPSKLRVAVIDGASGVTGPITLRSSQAYMDDVAAAFDGSNVLVVWREDDWFSNPYDVVSVKAMRVTPAGTPVDATPLVLVSLKDHGSVGLFPIDVGFDGSGYTVIWGKVNMRTAHGKVYARRVGIDGTLGAHIRKIYPNKKTKVTSRPYFIEPRIACVPGSCLVVWQVRDGEVSVDGAFVDKLYGIRLAGEELQDAAAFRLLTDASWLTGIASDGSDYLVVADRWIVCPGPAICGDDVVGARVSGAGVALDPNGIRLNNGPAETAGFPRSGGLSFDGTNYIATYLGGGANGATEIFATRMAPDGHVLDAESPGLLVHFGKPNSIWDTLRSRIASTSSDSIVTWKEALLANPNDLNTFSNPIYAQRVFQHAP